ncbi:hypothetical protein CVIRNUC_005269 [Coccomyxa viridis]|uniref:Non-structural maintenance of chromosomes element 4 n=1 Tax=Coccomyxa viridis TaxID=1274662 RepID=A0AAV1I5K6_9CHLO|nr:hypothetical protein CVIRNUC_005269 [Coccomyxa viridis]
MASTDPGPSNAEVKVKVDKLAQQAAKAEARRVESRKLLAEYHDMLKKVQGRTIDLNENKEFQRILQRANELLAQVSTAHEQVKDGEVFHQLCQSAEQNVREQIGGGKSRNPADLIRGLRARYVVSDGGDAQEDGANVPEAFNWVAFARDTAKYFKHAPGLSCMLGPISAEPKARRQVVRQKKQPLEKLVAAQDVDAVPEEQEEVIRNMGEMRTALTRQPRFSANLLACILNHRSFSQTVENLFALSFLVRDGRVTVTKAENGEGYTVTALDDASMTKLKEGKERTQVIIPLDMYDWEDFCTRMRPQDCLMSHRPPAVIPGAPRTPHTGGRRAEAGRAQKQHQQTPVEAEDDSDEEDEAAALRRRKGKKKARV